MPFERRVFRRQPSEWPRGAGCHPADTGPSNREVLSPILPRIGRNDHRVSRPRHAFRRDGRAAPLPSTGCTKSRRLGPGSFAAKTRTCRRASSGDRENRFERAGSSRLAVPGPIGSNSMALRFSVEMGQPLSVGRKSHRRALAHPNRGRAISAPDERDRVRARPSSALHEGDDPTIDGQIKGSGKIEP